MANEALPAPPSGVGTPPPDEGHGGAVFTNTTIDLANLPSIVNEDFESVDGRYLPLRLLSVLVPMAVLFTTVLLVGPLVLAETDLADPEPIIGYVSMAISGLTLLVLIVSVLEVRFLGFLVRAHDFSFRRGVLWRRVDTMPFARVQNVVITRGPFDRIFGLARLHLSSAGTDLFAYGLSARTAEVLKDLVVERAGAIAEEEQRNRLEDLEAGRLA